MKYISFLLLVSLSFCQIFAQTLQDDFSDGDFTINPTWSGSTADFIVNGSFQLQTDNFGSVATSVLSTAATIQDSTFWEFYVQMDFSPSNSNYTLVYLQSDNSILSLTSNGYYLRIGGSGSADSLEIYRLDSGVATKIFGATAGAVAVNPTVSVRIIRNNVGSWELFADYSGGTSYTSEGIFSDATYTSGTHFGFWATYTSTRGDKFFFDNVYLSPLLIDVTPPVIDSIAAVGSTQVDVYFDEIVDLTTAENVSNYSIDNGIVVSSAVRDVADLNLVHLNTTAMTSTVAYQLTINAVEDLYTNAIINAVDSFVYYNVQAATFQDIIINEIFADPTPQVALPSAEFVELLNRSSSIIDLGGMVFNDGSDKSLPSFLLFPDSIVVLVASNNVATYSAFGPTIDIGSLTMTNAGELIKLKDAGGQTIDSVDYDLSWYQDVSKENGGWSLELINPNLLCQGGNNWTASVNFTGGTPGQENSVFNNITDTQGPSLLAATFLNATTIELTFDEFLDGTTANLSGNYNIAGLTVSSAVYTAPDIVTLTVSTMVDLTNYTVVVTNINDCTGNPITLNNTASFTYVLVQNAAFQDVIINEIFADPSPQVLLPDAEFIELYNRSTKTINLGGMLFNDGADQSLPSFLLYPDSFVIVTSSANASSYSVYGDVLAIPSMNLTNSGELISLKTSGGQTIDSVSFALSWYQNSIKEDGGWSLELINPMLICQGADNWIASISNDGGTPGIQNSVFDNSPDIQGPGITSADFIDSMTIELIFDEALGANANVLTNYSVSSATVTNATFEFPNTVILTLASNMLDQVTYSVTISALTDCTGNLIGSSNVDSFVYYSIQLASYHDVIISEIFSDPTPIVGLPDAEFLELYNRSSKTIDLANYVLFETTNHTLPSQLMLPGAYVVLCSAVDQASFTGYGTVVPLPSLSLSNSGELLMLINSTGATVDSVVYEDNWYQSETKEEGGWSLELINPNLLCKGAANWIASNDASGGTPAAQNSMYASSFDTIPPAVITTRQYGPNQILIEFDDVLNQNISLSSSSYSVDNGAVVITVVGLSDTEVILTLGANMMDQTVYTITLNNIEDCVGNSMGVTTTSMIYYEAGAATHYDLIINEIMADPNPSIGLPEKEYVELYNRSNKTFNLEGFTFTDASSVVSTLPFFILEPGEYITIYSNADTIGYSSFGNVCEVASFPDLNTSDELVLRDQSGEVIDAVAYELSWYQNSDKDDGGWSLERINPDRPCEGASNWRASENLLGGSPSTENSVFNTAPDEQSPDALRAFPLSADSIRVYFSEAIADIAGALASNYSIDDPGINIISARIEAPFYNSVVLVLDAPLVLGATYVITMSANFTDCVGNAIGLNNTARVALAQEIQSGDFILNEVLFNPVTSGKDFIELYNKSNKILNTADLVISNAEIVDGNLVNASALQTTPIEVDWLVFPNEYVVITEGPDQVKNQYYTPNPGLFVENDLPTLADKEGNLFLYAAYDSTYLDSLGVSQTLYLAKVLDLFDYNEDFHSPLIDDKNGVSLERIDFDAPTNDYNNWHSAATEVGYATPAYKNSSFMINNIIGDDLVELPTETVSPDGDGYEDFLLINYNVDALGYVANIDIYDAKGLLVRNLINGELLTNEGSLQWDGTDNNGRKARLGIHVLAVEIFHPDGTVRRFKKTCVVAGRM
ncbi:MAG: lamin tail domain-containing protein [Saprospiraceae bacterium]|nr:lamin tail domain-containing protein [Saprospiraceae bacterium]